MKRILFGFLFALVMVFAIVPCFSRSVKAAEGNNYLTFTGTSDFSIKTKSSFKSWNGKLEYKTDKTNWTEWDGTTAINSANKVLYLRGKNTKITGNEAHAWIITISSGTVSCSGDIRTLLNYDDVESAVMDAGCFWGLFADCTSLTTAPDLPAKKLANQCYIYMFKGCTSLIKAPDLPATELAGQCYEGMFNGCTGLTTAPELLPATKLEGNCYKQMFDECTSLKNAPALPAATLAPECYLGMFRGCSSLTTAPSLPATTLADECYNCMFYGCTSLATAPSLPATTLTESCYCSMFNGCSSLTKAPKLPATTLAERCYNNMFRLCSGLKVAPELPATTLADDCYMGMFNECSSLVKAPDLPATTLTKRCYFAMFGDCKSMKFSETKGGYYNIEYRIPKSGTGTLGKRSVENMFTGTGGTFTGTPEINKTYYRFGYNVTVTGGSNAKASGGELSQIGLLSEEMTPVTFTADSGYHFEEFEDITKDGITIKRISDTVVTVSGTPTDIVELVVPNAVQDGKLSISKASVSGIKDKTYTGSPITQRLTVKIKNKKLKEGRDYTVSYKDNINAGTATVIIAGKGEYDYKVKKEVSFKIRPLTITKAKVTGLTDKTYTGEAIRQDVRVKLGKTVLTEGKDYTLTYKNNKKVGKATITVKGKGNYSGNCSAQFKIKKAPNTLKVEGKTATIKESGLKNKKGTIAVSKIRTITGKGQGSLTYKKKSGARCLSVNGKGKVTVAKNTAKGTYTMKVKVKAAGNANYEKAEKNITVTVNVE
ncbi:MAG: hypothetical protein IK152_04470 [Lachnospiraceae bacterium]|nr:hypothetical protein [Lachnospiraceae bacterium]